jgi:hypothetical protein
MAGVYSSLFIASFVGRKQPLTFFRRAATRFWSLCRVVMEVRAERFILARALDVSP